MPEPTLHFLLGTEHLVPPLTYCSQAAVLLEHELQEALGMFVLFIDTSPNTYNSLLPVAANI